MAGAVWSMTLQEASRLHESLPASREGFILHQQSDFEFSDVILGQETSIFSKFHDFQNFHLSHGNLDPVQIVSGPMDRAEVLHALSYDIELSWKNTTGNLNWCNL